MECNSTRTLITTPAIATRYCNAPLSQPLCDHQPDFLGQFRDCLGTVSALSQHSLGTVSALPPALRPCNSPPEQMEAL